MPDLELIELGAEECLALLATEPVGRLAVSRGRGTPLVVPVNYVLAETVILFRTGFGTKLPSLGARPVAFEVDRFEPDRRLGWSVLASGQATEVSERTAGDRLPDPWVPEHKPYLIGITVHTITGRRIIARTR
jgi:nitroimidazol reductase NimA-like FMN-containing flavoprotein (pyridoxamine 5'-phosphate oxidase superfamily)